MLAKSFELVDGLKSFSPKNLILTCTGCFRQFTELFPSLIDLDFKISYYTQFLYENLEKIGNMTPLDKSVALHESCTTRRTNISDSVIKIVQAIPGLTIVKNDDLTGQALCCGGVANTTYPQMGQKLGQNLADNIVKVKADYISTTCPFCRLTSYPYSRQHAFHVKDIATLLNISLGGIEYEDKLEKHWKCETIDEIIESSRENFEANGYTENEMRGVLPLLFPFAAR